MTKREAAIGLAKKGFRVFPIPAGSKAAAQDFRDTGSADADIARQRWTEAVGNDQEHHNIGIETGHEILVADFDVKHGEPGLEDLARFEAIGLDTSIQARTASGGIHVFMRLPKGEAVGGRTKTLELDGWIAKGTDIKGANGYVVGPGSETSTGAYQWINEPKSLEDIPFAPNWLIKAIGKPIERSGKDEAPPCGWDTPVAINLATSYLINVAPKAELGNRGYTALQVAYWMRDYGVSEDKAFELISDLWNVEGKVDPPADPDEVRFSVKNAYRYAQNAPGCKLPQEFHDVTQPDWPSPTPFSNRTGDDVPPRQWIVDGIVARRFVTGLVAPSGAGKTQWLAQLALAITTGKGETANVDIKEQTSVWYWNQEDDLDELDRRTIAARQHYDLPKSGNRLYLDSGVDRPLMLMGRDPNGHLRRTKHVATIIRHIKEKEIGVFIVDPTIEFHEANENDNVEMRQVVAVLRHIAVEANCAVLFGHHTKKPDGASSDGFAGNADSGRGASAMQGVTRVMLTLYSMSIKDAKLYGVKDDDRSAYVRLDGAKSNISPAGRGQRPKWMKWHSVQLALDGDQIGVLEAVELVRAGTRVERQIDGAESLATILAKRDDAGAPVRWPDVIPDMMDATGWSHDKVRRWITGVDHGTSKTNSGELDVNKKAGKGGIIVKVNSPVSASDE